MLMAGIWSEGEAQNAKKKKKTETRQPVKKEVQGSHTAAAFRTNQHVYFPDYYAFYDPNRGYVFWNQETKTWNSSLQPPKFMSKVDMSHTRVQILKDLSLDLHPEQNYPNYMKLYPAQTANPDVPVPNSRQTAGDGY